MIDTDGLNGERWNLSEHRRIFFSIMQSGRANQTSDGVVGMESNQFDWDGKQGISHSWLEWNWEGGIIVAYFSLESALMSEKNEQEIQESMLGRMRDDGDGSITVCLLNIECGDRKSVV